MGMNSANVDAAHLTRVNCTRVGKGVIRIGSVSNFLGRGAPVVMDHVASNAVVIRGREGWCSLGGGVGKVVFLLTCLSSDQECCLPSGVFPLHTILPLIINGDVKDRRLASAAVSGTCAWHSTMCRHTKGS